MIPSTSASAASTLSRKRRSKNLNFSSPEVSTPQKTNWNTQEPQAPIAMPENCSKVAFGMLTPLTPSTSSDLNNDITMTTWEPILGKIWRMVDFGAWETLSQARNYYTTVPFLLFTIAYCWYYAIETHKNSEKSIYNIIPFLRDTEKRKPGMSELEFRS